MLPKPKSSSPVPEESPTPNIAEYIKSIPSWSPEEQKILEENMKQFPVSQNAEFKRLTLLMTNLPNKRLRDISFRVKYMKAKETQDISWETFLQMSFNQQKVELSPTHSVKSPRATPINKEEKPKKKQRAARVKKDDDELSLSRESNGQLSVNSYRERDLSIGGNSQTMMNQQMYQQMGINGQNRIQMNASIMSDQMNHRQFGGMMPQPHYQNQMRQQSMIYQQRDRMITPEEQTCQNMIVENEYYIEMITNAILNKTQDISEFVSRFHNNIKHLMNLTEQMDPAHLPIFVFTPSQVNLPNVNKFRKIEMQPDVRQQSQHRNEFQMNNNQKGQRDERRPDLM